MRIRHIRQWIKGGLCWVQVPILGGPLQGSRFGLFTGTRFIRGTYGRKEAATFQRLLGAGDVVFDVGAHVGYFTLLASNIVRSGGRVFAFEPLPLNLAYLNQHKRANRLTNVEILPVAVGRQAARMSFGSPGGTGRGQLVDGLADGQRHVQVVSLDQMFDEGKLPGPDLIKIDVEGVEGEALRGASMLLRRFRPKILLSVHGSAAKQGCESFLADLGYQHSYFKQSTIIALPRAA